MKGIKKILVEVAVDFPDGFHVREMANEIINRKLINDDDQKRVLADVITKLAYDVKSRKPVFERILTGYGYKRGYYRLRHLKGEFPASPAGISASATESADSGRHDDDWHLIHGAVYSVLGEMSYNGIDALPKTTMGNINTIICVHEAKIFPVRVYCSFQYSSGASGFVARIPATDYKKFTYHIIVHRSSSEAKEFLVFHYSDLERFLGENKAQRENDHILLAFEGNGKGILLHQEKNMGYYLGNFRRLLE